MLKAETHYLSIVWVRRHLRLLPKQKSRLTERVETSPFHSVVELQVLGNPAERPQKGHVHHARLGHADVSVWLVAWRRVTMRNAKSWGRGHDYRAYFMLWRHVANKSVRGNQYTQSGLSKSTEGERHDSGRIWYPPRLPWTRRGHGIGSNSDHAKELRTIGENRCACYHLGLGGEVWSCVSHLFAKVKIFAQRWVTAESVVWTACACRSQMYEWQRPRWLND